MIETLSTPLFKDSQISNNICKYMEDTKMKTLKTSKWTISTLVLITQFGLAQITLAENSPGFSPNESVSNTEAINSAFVSIINNRSTMTSEIIDRLREEAGVKGYEGWEEELTSALDNADSEAFLAAYNAGKSYSAVLSGLVGLHNNQEALVNDFNAGGAASVLSNFAADGITAGGTDDGRIYYPTAPCRILSTTGDAGGKISAGTSRSFHVHGTSTKLSSQGGGSCLSNSNLDAYAYAINITVHQVEGAGHLRIYAEGDSLPNTSILNFDAGTNSIANSTIVKISRNIGKDFKIYSTTNAHVIVDVMGYYEKPKKIKPDVYTVKKSKLVSGHSNANIFAPDCPSDYRLISGGIAPSRFEVHVVLSRANEINEGKNKLGAGWSCSVRNTGSLSATVTCYGYCLKIPGR